MTCDAIRFYEKGGIGGQFGSTAVLVGTHGFMRAMGVHMNEEARVRLATYVSVNGELAGLIAIRYNASRNAQEAVRMLTAAKIKPVIATCNSTISPKMLKAKFSLTGEHMFFPPLKERAALAALSPEEDDRLCALVTKRRIDTLANLCAGAKNLRSIVLVGIIMSILSGLSGLAVAGILCLMGAVESLSAI